MTNGKNSIYVCRDECIDQYNPKRVVGDIDFDVGTEGLQCQCGMSVLL